MVFLAELVQSPKQISCHSSQTAQSLSAMSIKPKNFSLEGIWLLHEGSCKFQLSLKVLILKQEFLSRLAASQYIAMQNLPPFSSSWQSWWFLNILTNFLSSKGDRLGVLPNDKVETHQNNMCNCLK